MTQTAEEHLTTGWEPDVPAGDTMLRRYLLHHVACSAAFVRSIGGTVEETPQFVVTDARRSAGLWNAATLLAPPSDWDATLDDVEARVSGGDGTVGLWSAWPTPDLRARGWTLSGHPPLLIRPPANVLPLPEVPAPDVGPVRTLAELADWERVAIEGYPMPDLAGAPTGSFAGPALLDDPRLRFYTGRADGQVVSAAASFTDVGVVSLAFGATLPAARRRGLWRQLATTRLRERPDVWAVGVFSDFSRPGAEALGFVPVTRLTLWILDRGAGRN